MPRVKPYFRILRPFIDGSYLRDIENTYLLDKRYSNDRVPSIRSFHILVKDIMDLFEYVEPCKTNESTFSHRIYALFLRASTEFESNCKAILQSNGYSSRGNWNMKDYFKLNTATKFSEYTIRFNVWQPEPIELRPFSDWGNDEYKQLKWYKEYNNIKHNRSQYFESANIINLINAMAAVLITLYSQYYVFAFDPYQIIPNNYSDAEGNSTSTINGMFEIKSPTSWNPDEKYEFNWNSIKSETNPYEKFNFES